MYTRYKHLTRHTFLAGFLFSLVCHSCAESVAERQSGATTPDGLTISWREHIIDDPSLGVANLSGSDGFAMADLDGDGFEDIVSVHESDTVYDGKPVGHVRIAWGSADPTVWQLSTLASGHEAAAAEDVSIADANGDGWPDIVVACELAHLIYFQNPGGQQRDATWRRVIPPITEHRGSWIRVFFADFNRDGQPEIVAANKGEQNPDTTAVDQPNNISIFHLPSDPLIGRLWREQVLGKVLIPINAEPVDLDRDGDLDVVAGSRGERRILWYENKGRFLFDEHVIRTSPEPEGLAMTGFNMDFMDLDGDNKTDIISTAWPGTILLLRQPDSFNENWQLSRIGDAPPDQLVSIRLGDVNSDGLPDIFTGAYSRGPRDKDGHDGDKPAGLIAWFANPGLNKLTEPWIRHDISRRIRGMYDKWLFRDLDNDGDLDVIGTRGNSEPFDGVIWLEQLRDKSPGRSFTPARSVDSVEAGSAVR